MNSLGERSNKGGYVDLQSNDVKTDAIEPKKPTREEICNYARPILKKYIGKKYRHIPEEQREEMEQEGYLRILNAYDIIRPTEWKSFIYTHCNGAVQDYDKFGKGFEEQRWSIAKTEEHEAVHVNKIRHRVEIPTDEDGNDAEFDQVLGFNGVFAELDVFGLKIKWDLAARLASNDIELLCFLKLLREFTVEEIAVSVGVSRSVATQYIQNFVQRMELMKRNMQTIYALGLCYKFGMKDVDQSTIHNEPLGNDVEPINILDDIHYIKETADVNQMALF